MSMQQRREYYQRFDTTLAGNFWRLPTLGAELAIVGAEAQTTWPSGAVVTWYRSLDGVTPYALETAVFLSAVGLSATIDAAGFPYLIAQVTTAAAGYINLYAEFSAAKP